MIMFYSKSATILCKLPILYLEDVPWQKVLKNILSIFKIPIYLYVYYLYLTNHNPDSLL